MRAKAMSFREAALALVSVIERSRTGTPSRYLVEYHCCGRVAELSRDAIRHRAINGATLCKRCAGLKALPDATMAAGILRRDAAPNYGVTPPQWPVPRASLVGVHVPFYDRAEE